MNKTLKKNTKKSTSDKCPVRNVLDRFGDKWSVLILLSLDKTDKIRFNELHKSIGDISQKMLTATLRTLEADGLIKRTIYAEVPPRVEYEITPRGKTLLPHIHALVDWAIQNIQGIKTSRSQYLA